MSNIQIITDFLLFISGCNIKFFQFIIAQGKFLLISACLKDCLKHPPFHIRYFGGRLTIEQLTEENHEI